MTARQRRSTLSAGLVVVLAAASGACSSNTAGAPSGAQAPTRDASTALSESASQQALVLGPDGVGPIRLGMTHQAVAESGAAETFVGSRHDGWPRGCRIVVYRPDVLGQLDTINGSVSRQEGLEQLSATALMATPEGVRLGSSMTDVSSAYGLSDIEPGETIVVRASDTADYRIQLDPDVVTWISLELRARSCNI